MKNDMQEIGNFKLKDYMGGWIDLDFHTKLINLEKDFEDRGLFPADIISNALF